MVRHPGAVVVVPVEPDREHVLLVRQYRAAADRELLEVVAGKRDVDGEAARDDRVARCTRRSAAAPAGW